MKLLDAHIATLIESKFFNYINEEGEAPKWNFQYDNWHQDPHPDILLLGAYQHPKTRNNLVGGINLHYLNTSQLNELRKFLPNIMGARNLYQRYHTGKRLLPDIFNDYYRTYNSSYIRGVNQDILYPKYGFLKTTSNWLKKKVGGIFKSKDQRQQEAQPKFAPDLQNMRNQLDQTVAQLQQQTKEPPNSPEMQAARKEFQRRQKERTKSIGDIEKDEDIPLDIAQQQFRNPELDNQLNNQNKTEPRSVSRNGSSFISPQSEIQDPNFNQPEDQFEEEKRENEEELENPKNDLPPLGEEFIFYHSPLRGLVIEPALSTGHFSHSNYE